MSLCSETSTKNAVKEIHLRERCKTESWDTFLDNFLALFLAFSFAFLFEGLIRQQKMLTPIQKGYQKRRFSCWFRVRWKVAKQVLQNKYQQKSEGVFFVFHLAVLSTKVVAIFLGIWIWNQLRVWSAYWVCAKNLSMRLYFFYAHPVFPRDPRMKKLASYSFFH